MKDRAVCFGGVDSAMDAHAVAVVDGQRILSRSWTHDIWRCWRDRAPYDPARHGGLERLVEARG
jgi:hypothetical protein